VRGWECRLRAGLTRPDPSGSGSGSGSIDDLVRDCVSE
jgi:hypothetical protein